MRAATDAKMHTAQELQEQASGKEAVQVRPAGMRALLAGARKAWHDGVAASHVAAVLSVIGSCTLPSRCVAVHCAVAFVQAGMPSCRCPSAATTAASTPPQVDERTRVVYIDQAQQRETGRTFESNRVVTSKYNIITFLPIFLFEMFSRVAYLYFLLQARRGRPLLPAAAAVLLGVWCA